MGDTRFDRSYELLKPAQDRAAAVRRLGDWDVIAALAASSRHHDPLLANILATEAFNRMGRYGVVRDALGDGLLTTGPSGLVEQANPAAVLLLALPSAADALGRDVHRVVHERSCRECPVTLALAAHEVSHGETDFLRGDGSRLEAAFTSAPVRIDGEEHGHVLLFRDIGPKNRVERALRKQRDLYETLVRVQSEFGIGVVLVEEHRILSANEAFCSLLQRSLEDLQRIQDVLDLTPSDIREFLNDLTARHDSGETTPEQFDLAILNAKGERVEIEVAVKEVPSDHGSRAIVVVRPRPARPPA